MKYFMRVSRRAVFAVFLAMLCAAVLLASCQFVQPPEAAASPPPSAETAASEPSQTAAAAPTHATYRSYAYISMMQETTNPADYDVLSDDSEYLQYDENYNSLLVYVWRIESFDFLNDFNDIKKLIIYECYIPEGVTIPPTDALKDVTEIQIGSIYGSGAADVLADCLPLPKLDILDISGGVPNKSVLPAIPALTDLYVSVPGALNVISNNTQITGALVFGVPFLNDVYESIVSIDGIEKFSSIQYLRLPHSVRDISPVAGCAALRILDISSNDRIDSLRPLYRLEQLEELSLREQAYNALPEDERAHFSPDNNGDAGAVHVYGISGYDDIGEDYLQLSEEKIGTFDFLSEYPNLKSLSIIDCDIADGLVLPKIDTLTHLSVIDPNALELIKNNTQLVNYLEVGTGYSLYTGEDRKGLIPLSTLSGLEKFSSIETLNVLDPVTDISALAGCRNLRSLSLLYCTSIETLRPLYALNRLRMLTISPDTFYALPQEDRARFTDRHKPYAVDLEWR